MTRNFQNSDGKGAEIASLQKEATQVLADLGPAFADAGASLSELHGRLQEGRFHLAVLGQFKRGKSTLLNALLGENILPSAVIPVTAVPTFLQSGSGMRARVHFETDEPPQDAQAAGADELRAFIARYVTEDGNPGNRLRVSEVEVFLNAPILSSGVVLIDTPGIGSIHRHNTEVTLNFLPRCDAALFMTSADPPLTETEIDFLRQVRERIPYLFFVLNKVDYLTEQERSAALAFLRNILHQQAGIPDDTPVFCTSARAALQAALQRDEELQRRSGLEELRRHLLDFLARRKTEALHHAIAARSGEVTAAAAMQVRLAARSLELPLDELKRRLAEFDAKLQQIAAERRIAADLLAGDRRRIHEFLEAHAADLRSRTILFLEGMAEELLAGKGLEELTGQAIQKAFDDTVPGYFEHQMGESTRLIRKRIAAVLEPHQHRADELIASVRRTAAELFEIPFRAPSSSSAFELVRKPYWISHHWSASLGSLAGVADTLPLLPAAFRRRRLLARLKRRIAALTTSNVENLRWSLYQSIDHSFRTFTATLDERLAAAIRATHGAVKAAAEQRSHHDAAVRDRLAQLNEAAARLEEIAARLKEAYPAQHE